MQKVLVRMIDRVKVRELETELNGLLEGGKWKVVSITERQLSTAEVLHSDPLMNYSGYKEIPKEGEKSPPFALGIPIVLMVVVLESADDALQTLASTIAQKELQLRTVGIKEACPPPERAPYQPRQRY